MVARNTAWLQSACRDVQPFPCWNPYATQELPESQYTICQQSTLVKIRKVSRYESAYFSNFLIFTQLTSCLSLRTVIESQF